ncbi:PhzF family phenazine biosynthesis protein [Ancylomarina longa]|uniref:PhzF family phenazine biosynthesis protein n=1 Tax=Ancylomarina longa TaxID=2487017 RepID=A0A434AGG0_9BACT|nr:PhzF family phenazine biosynthesis protein [Ancylomarina longa]RUT73467.1 PhzF family phenazine biosynthesis protein [Ancylomarina longa]
MKIQKYHVDAFTDRLFGGNPACVIPLQKWLPDDILFQITKENNLAETAFFIPIDDGFHIRWFTPEVEMDLCGHASLASAHVIREHLHYKKDIIYFQSASGDLQVSFEGDKYVLDFPSRIPVKAELPQIIKESLNIQPSEVFLSRDYVLLYESEEEISTLKLDENKLKQIDLGHGGIICTAAGTKSDFISRFFTPGASIFEDPVTGSAHCSLIPFWSKKNGKKEQLAFQVSERKGVLYCKDEGERVSIAGQAITYSVGEIFLPNSDQK